MRFGVADLVLLLECHCLKADVFQAGDCRVLIDKI